MKKTIKLLKFERKINLFEKESDGRALGIIDEYRVLSEKIELSITSAQLEKNVVEFAFFLRETYRFSREKIENFSETESVITNNYRKLCNFFIGASVSPVFSFFLKKIDNEFLNSKVLTESFFLGLSREMLSIDNVKKKEKVAKINKIISLDPNLPILEQLELIIVLKDQDEASKWLNNCKGFIDELKSSVEDRVLQSTFQTSRKLAAQLQLLFKISQNNNKLYAICVLFQNFADMEEQSTLCVSNCVKTSQSISEKLALSIAKVILQEEGFFDARPMRSCTQPEFRFSKYKTTFPPISLEQRFFTNPPSLPPVSSCLNQEEEEKARFSYNPSEFDCDEQTSEASLLRNSLIR